MVELSGFTCGLCNKPIVKGTGFSFPPNPLGIKYSHQKCYNEYYALGKSFVENPDNSNMVERMKRSYEKQ